MRARLPFALAVVLASLPAWSQVEAGRALFADPRKGDCLACHQVPEGAGPASRADVGPRLDGTRLKGWDAPRLRALLDDPQRIDPDTVKPPYGRHRILEPAEIDRIVEYLRALP